MARRSVLQPWVVAVMAMAFGVSSLSHCCCVDGFQPTLPNVRATCTPRFTGETLHGIYMIQKDGSLGSSQKQSISVLSAMGDDDKDKNNDEQATPSITAAPYGLDLAGIVAQPIVWISLYAVATTGSGLPAGPLGLLGALEGVSYLVIVGFAGSFLYGNLFKGSSSYNPTEATLRALVEKMSAFTIVAGLLILLKLVGDEGCVPNAKPLLDYSAYVPVCGPEQTPGLFGSSS